MNRVLVFLLLAVAATPATMFAAGVEIVPSADATSTSISLSLDNAGGCVVAGEVAVEYDATAFELSVVDREVSVFTLWFPDATSTGKIILTGGVPGGFCGLFSGEGIVTSLATLTFTPLTPAASLRDSLRIGTTTLFDGYGTIL